MKVSELASILSRLDESGEIGIERSRQTDIAGVIEVELYELGIKKHAIPDASGGPPRDTYLLYATTKATPASLDEPAAGSPMFSTPGASRRRPVMDTRPLVAASTEDGS
jgi:hypothetical protein